MKKNKMWSIIGTICLIASSILIFIQMRIRYEDNQEKKRKWDAEAEHYTIQKCLKLYIEPPKDDGEKITRNNVCDCYLEKLKNSHTFYASRYYLENEEHQKYLHSCQKQFNDYKK